MTAAPVRQSTLDRFFAIGLSRECAASFIGVSANTFDAMVKEGNMPQPRRVGARKLWDRRELEAAFDVLPRDGETTTNPWDEAAA
jgi:predicted DNA-binding transcriptional regulator AlpA